MKDVLSPLAQHAQHAQSSGPLPRCGDSSGWILKPILPDSGLLSRAERAARLYCNVRYAFLLPAHINGVVCQHVAVKHCWKASQAHMSARSAIYSASFRAVVIPIHMLQSLLMSSYA